MQAPPFCIKSLGLWRIQITGLGQCCQAPVVQMVEKIRFLGNMGCLWQTMHLAISLWLSSHCEVHHEYLKDGEEIAICNWLVEWWHIVTDKSQHRHEYLWDHTMHSNMAWIWQWSIGVGPELASNTYNISSFFHYYTLAQFFFFISCTMAGIW